MSKKHKQKKSDFSAKKRESLLTTCRDKDKNGELQPIILAHPNFDMVVKFFLFPALLLIVIIFLCLVPIEEADLWFHMALGRYFWEHWSLPKGDIFSFTSAGREYISTGWLSSVFLYLLWEKVGRGVSAIGVSLFVFIQVLVAYFAIYITAVRRQVHTTIFFLLLLALPFASYRFNPRPDVCSQLMISLLLLLLISSEKIVLKSQDSKRKFYDVSASTPLPGLWRFWILPLLILLWTNLHVGFISGLAVIAIYSAHLFLLWVKKREKSYFLALIPCSLCSIIWILNPYGINVIKLIFKIKSVPQITEMLFEWMPLYNASGENNLSTLIYVDMIIFLALFVVIIMMRRTRLPWWHLVTMIFFIVITWNARRQMGLVALALPVLAIPHSEGFNRRLLRNYFVAPLLGIVISITICLLQVKGAIIGYLGLPSMELNRAAFPVDAVKFLKNNRPPDNLFNSYHFGSYLLYYLGPEIKVFIDGRIDTYDPQIWVDDRAIEANLISIDEACRRYNLNTFIIDKRPFFDPGRLYERLATRSDFELVYQDYMSAIFIRKSPASEKYLNTLSQNKIK